MREYVYLFELDSVRKTDEEIIAGQKALYNEIVNNGNIVVLTYNQLVDSRGFFSLLKDSEYQKYYQTFWKWRNPHIPVWWYTKFIPVFNQLCWIRKTIYLFCTACKIFSKKTFVLNQTKFIIFRSFWNIWVFYRYKSLRTWADRTIWRACRRWNQKPGKLRRNSEKKENFKKNPKKNERKKKRTEQAKLQNNLIYQTKKSTQTNFSLKEP